MAVKEYLVIITDATALKGETAEKAVTTSRIGQLLIDLAEKGQAVETGKVSIEVGKGLSENNFTTTLLQKLNGIADGANAYVHPSNHDPSIISQDANNRFVSDTEKSTWNGKQAALGFTPENAANKNAVNGYAGLGADGKINSSQLPAIAVTDTFVVNSEASMLALNAQTGDVCIRTDQIKTYILKDNNPALLASWAVILSPTGDIVSVNGKTGVVVLVASDLAEDSTHRFVTDSEKATWNSKAAGTHTHEASEVTQSSSARFVTDTEKATWNGKANAAHTHVVSDVTEFDSSVRGIVLTGISFLTNAAITASDTVLSALGKLQKQITDLLTTVDRNAGVSNVTTLASLPISKRLVFATVSAATTISLASALSIGNELHIIVYNNSASAITQTLPNTGSFISLSGTSISIPAGGRIEINILCYASTSYLIRAL